MLPNRSSKSTFLRGRVVSFGYALTGLVTLWRTQPNVRIHAAVTVLVIAAAAWLQVSIVEWCVLLGMIGLVMVAEALNTAIEFVADAVSTEPHPFIKQSKDVAAAAVLIAAMLSVLVGVLIFSPYIIRLC